MEDGFLLKRLVKFMECRETQFADGQMMVLLSLKELQGVCVVILFLKMAFLELQKTPNEETIISMLEYLLQNEEKTWIDKQPFYGIDTRIISLLKILDLDSITKERDFLDYLNYQIMEKSNRLWSSARTDCVDLDLNSYNDNLIKTIQNSWFTSKLIKPQKQNFRKIFLPFYRYLYVDGMEKENIKLLRTRKYKLKLNSLQKKLLEKHRHNYRFIYNKTVGILNDREIYDTPEFIKNTTFEKASSGTYYSKYELRDLIAPKEVNCRTPWVLETGFNIRAQAVFEAHKNWQTNIDLVKDGVKKFFNLKFKTKKAPTWTFNVEHQNITTRKDAFDKTEFKLYEESGFMKTTESFEIEKDASIHFDGKHYYILVPEDRPVKCSKADNFFVALDPGVRKFQTCYSPGPNEHIVVIGERASTKIYELLLMIDNAISTKNKKLKTRLRIRVKNLQKELHDKTSRFLCENYNVIYVPKLTKGNDIIKKEKRKLRTKTVRNMVLLAHCKFIEKLKIKASEYSNVKVIIVTEEYTSQTCLECHHRTKTSNELFKCKHCGFEIDRDILGSINILLKQWGLM